MEGSVEVIIIPRFLFHLTASDHELDQPPFDGRLAVSEASNQSTNRINQSSHRSTAPWQQGKNRYTHSSVTRRLAAPHLNLTMHPPE